MKFLKRHLFLLMLILIIITLGLFETKNYLQKQEQTKNEIKNNELAIQKINETKELETKYQKCLEEPFLSIDTANSIKLFLDKYSSSDFAIYFEDINNNYTITKNENTLFYGASLIKLFDAAYLIEKAINNEINLETETVEYLSKYVRAYSDNMAEHKIGDKVSLKDLISYILLTSDNSAHEMLFDYIGANNLKDYAKTLGVNLTINDYDHFGYLTAEDTHKILEKIYYLINLDNEYSDLLKDNMSNTYFNSLNFDNITILHKYGSYDPYFHDIGIYNNPDYPYYISIMTTIGEQASPNKITELHKEIKKIYNTNLEQKEEYCYKMTYN